MSSNITITNKLSIQDEGIPVVDNAKSLNFIGSGVTATAVGNDVTITVTGGGGGGGVSSVGLSMPSAFTVTNSPILTGGTIAVTGAGLTTDYIRGDGSLAALPAITGSTGTIDRHAKWITATTLGDSLISDNGTRLNIGGSYVSNTILSIQSGGSNLYGVNIFATDDALIGYTFADYGTGISGYAVVGTGVYGESSGYPSFGLGGTNIGVHGKAFETDLPALTTCIGGKFEALSGANNYSLQLIDGTQGTGKFLKSVNASGAANWANITAADVSGLIDGGGTLNYLSKWTPDGSSLGDSQILDDGTTLSIGTAPSPTIQFNIQSNKSRGLSVTGLSIGVYGEVNFTGANGNYYGLYGSADNVLGSPTKLTYGVFGEANGGRGAFGRSTGGAGSTNIGVEGQALDAGLPPEFGTATLNIGGKFTATGALDNHSIQLIDGTETVAGRFLKNITTDGKANWATLTVADTGLTLTTTGTSGAATLVGNTLNIPQYTPDITGSGTLNHVARWSSSSTLSIGALQDNASTVAVGGSVLSTAKFYVYPDASVDFGISSNSAKSGGIAVDGASFGVGSATNVGLRGTASGSTSLSIGVYGSAGASAGTNVGLYGNASGGALNYGIQLVDGSETTAGTFLKNIVDGKANWATITAADVSGAIDGSGTLNYVPKWTPDGTSLGDSLIYSSATTVQIGQVTGLSTPNNILRVIDDYKYSLFSVEGTSPTGATYALSAQNTQNGGFPSQHSQTATAIQAYANLSSTLNIGVEARTQGNDPSLTTNIGIWARGGVSAWNGLLGIGGKFEAYGVSKYAVQLIDGTETVAGRFLKNMTTDGKANWATLTVADTGLTLTTTGTTGAATLVGNTLNIPQYSGGGGSQTLAQTLVLGNSAGTTDINMNNNDITNIDNVSTSSTTLQMQAVLNSALIFYANNC